MSTHTQPGIYPTLPTFGIIPEPLPRTLPAPANEGSIRAPFSIDPWIYNAVLRPEVPITFASTYVLAVAYLNHYNRTHGNKPWSISQQPYFKWFVVLHNGLLTIYSAATFLAMCRAIAHTWPGWNPDGGFARIADSLCKMHGPRGLGDAATYNTTINIWESKNSLIRLGFDGNPDPTDVGRLWNEGLAFWGWFFYVSKFYEVIDTLIIIAKGKRSATLQTYHHSGAMLCMWAGIRFMSPPIWMFVFVNSFIHALMYTYFTLAALNIKVPTRLKRSLTSLQIAQFLWGSTYAAAHLFIKYDIPISTPYQVVRTVKAAASSISSAASAASSTASVILHSPAASGTLAAVVKKLLLRAVGEEGMAERVTNNLGEGIAQYVPDGVNAAVEKTKQIFETHYHHDSTTIKCIDTSGEAFAIYLNLLYLFPLTFLFARFFVKSYLRRGKARTASEAARQAVDAGREAKGKTKDAVEKAGVKAEEELGKDTDAVRDQLRKDVKAMKDGTWGRDRRVSDHVSNLERQFKSAAEKAKDQARKPGSGTSSPRRASPSKRSPIEPASEKTAAEPAPKQDEVLAKTEAVRPAPDDSTTISTANETEDTDAMGKSGAIVDLVAEKAEASAEKAAEVKEEVKEAVAGEATS